MTARLTDVTTRRPIRPSRRPWAAWIGVGVMLALLVLGVILHSPWLSVREIEIAGAERVDAAARLDRAGIGTGAIMLWLDTAEVEAAVSGHPWAAEVRAAREWPHRLVVEIVERQPALWIEGTGEWMLVATDGTILEIAPEPGAGLLRVSLGMTTMQAGIRPADPVWGELVALSEALSVPVAASSVVLEAEGEIWMATPGHPVRFGHPIDLADKGRVAEVMLADGLPAGATLDLVAPRRPAVVPGNPFLSLQPGVEALDEGDPAPAVEGEGSGT